MDIKRLIEDRIKERGELRVADIVRETQFSRAYVQRFFRELINEKKITLVGRANKAKYVIFSKVSKNKKTKIVWDVKNSNLNEDIVWNKVIEEVDIISGIKKNIYDILNYSFTEILNNAIEHSAGSKIRIVFVKDDEQIKFDISDNGIGIFNNIAEKKNLKNVMEAIQDLIKGKQTTDVEAHTGEGIFFTSKLADKLVIYGSSKKILFDNIIDDIFVQDNPTRVGTRVFFKISLDSRRKSADVFNEYAGESFEFSKTKVIVKLFKADQEYISRSQARRIVSGLNQFKEIVFDFDRVDTVGQGFADEIFRVWQNNNPNITITNINVGENVQLMIDRALTWR